MDQYRDRDRDRDMALLNLAMPSVLTNQAFDAFFCLPREFPLRRNLLENSRGSVKRQKSRRETQGK